MIKKRISKAFKRPTRDILINSIASSVIVNTSLRRMIYKIYGMNINGQVWINHGCTFLSSDIEIGKQTWINSNCVFNNSSTIKIGRNCNIAFNVMFICSTHEMGSHERRAGQGINSPIIIGDGCWVGANVTILPGIRIDDGCVIGAGSVVTKNCEANGVYAGNPAKLIKKLEL